MEAEDIINPADFKSIKIKVSMENTTTRTKVDAKNEVRFLEFIEDGVVLDVPPNSCAKGHNLMVELKTKNTADPMKFKFSAKVDEVEKLDDKRQAIHLTLLQYDKKTWEQFMNIFSNRQDEIETFFKAVKGL